jgi:signal peptidase II
MCSKLVAGTPQDLHTSFTAGPYTQSVTSDISTASDAPQTLGDDAPVADSEPKPARQRRSLFTDPIPWLLLAASLGLDQLTKAIVIGNLSRGESWPDSGFFRITHAWNTGTAFSLLQDQSDLLTFISFGAVIALYFVYRSVQSPNIWVRMAFGLLLGGAIGNLTDRLRLGHVTDFVDIGLWPIFNVADSSIVVGIAVLFLYFWTSPPKTDKKKEPSIEAPDASDSASDTAENTGGGSQQETG